MEKVTNRKFLGVLFCTLVIWLFSYPLYAEEITIVGEVNDSFQVVADGQIYEVADTPLGDDLVRNYMAVKVKVKGMVEEKEDMKIITVTSFEVIPE